MRATVLYGAGDVRIENVADARLIEPTDALVAVSRGCICGSDLWPYKLMEPGETGRRMGHEFIGVVEAGRRPFDADRIVVAVPTQKESLRCASRACARRLPFAPEERPRAGLPEGHDRSPG